MQPPTDFKATVNGIAEYKKDSKALKKEIKNAISADGNVRQAFLKWKEANPGFFRLSSFFLKIWSRMQVEDGSKVASLAVRVKELTPFKPPPEKEIEKILFKDYQKWDFYVESHLQSLEQILILLTGHFNLGTVNYLKALFFYRILYSKVGDNEFLPPFVSALLSSEEIFETAVSFFKGFYSGTFEDRRNFVFACLDLEDQIKPEVFAEIFNIPDNEGNTALHDVDLFEAALPYLEKLEPKKLFKFLNTKNFDQDIPLHAPVIFKKALPLLKKLSTKDRITLCTAEDKEGSTPFHEQEIVKEGASLFNDADGSFLEKLFCNQDSKGKTPLHNPDIFKKVYGLLMKLPAQSLNRLFALQTFEDRDEIGDVVVGGQTLLHKGEIKEAAQPLLLKLDRTARQRLLSMEDQNGEIP